MGAVAVYNLSADEIKVAVLEALVVEGHLTREAAEEWAGKPVDMQRVEGELIISWGGTRRGDDGDD